MAVSTASLVNCRAPTGGRARGTSSGFAEKTSTAPAHVEEVNARAEAPCSHARRLIVTIFGDPAEEMRNWTGPAEDTVRDRYLAAFGRALPGLSAEELWFRMRGILAVVAVDRVEVYNQPTPGCLSPVAGEAARRWAITFLAAAMSAPPTGT